MQVKRDLRRGATKAKIVFRNRNLVLTHTQNTLYFGVIMNKGDILINILPITYLFPPLFVETFSIKDLITKNAISYDFRPFQPLENIFKTYSGKTYIPY